MIWNLRGKQNPLSLKGKQEEEKKEMGVLVSFLAYLTLHSPCLDMRTVGLFVLITAYWENEESEISQKSSFVINVQYLLLSEEIGW